MMKKKIIGVFLGILMISLGQNSAQTTNSDAQKMSFNNKMTLGKLQLADTNLGSVAAYEKNKEFVSNVVRPNKPFTSLGFEWNEFSLPDQSYVGIFIRVRQQNIWTDWYTVPRDGDHKDEGEENNQELGAQSSFLPVNVSDAYQYKILLTGDGTIAPIVSNLSITTINAKEGIGVVAGKPHISAEITQDMISSQRVNIISRAGWGADESLRVYKGSDEVAPVQKLDPGYADKFSDELQIVKKVMTNEKGEKLSWPLEYTERVSKIIVHHTASTANLNNPKQAIRDIYYWHAMGRSWGDIGYNYVVDPQGNIYEGRYGGEKVIGAHAGRSNAGAIGISVMGNYETGEVSDASLTSLARLISEKSTINGIDPTGKSMFRGQITNNVLGHRDVMSTSCPGKNLYDRLPLVAQLARASVSTTVEEPAFKKQKEKGYDFSDGSGILYVSLDPDQQKDLTITIKNTGTLTWTEQTSLVVNDYDSLKDSVQVLPPNGRITFPMTNPQFVFPGSYATFHVTLSGGFKSSLKTLKLVPIINGKTKLYKYIGISVQTTPAIFSYDVVASSPLPKAMKAGERSDAWIDLKNTGNVNWQSDGNKVVRLGTDRAKDSKPTLAIAQGGRVGFLTQSVVKPGETGRFTVKILAPDKNEIATQYLTPVVEGVTWMADKSLAFSTFVYQKKYAATSGGIAKINAPQDSSQYVTVRLVNMGGEAWNKTGGIVPTLVKTGVSRAKLLSSDLVDASVEPGQIGNFTVQLQTGKLFAKDKLRLNAYIGRTRLLVAPVTINITKIASGSITPYTPSVPVSPVVTPAPTTSYVEPVVSSSNPASNMAPTIRVLIGFNGTPTISGSGQFHLESGAITHTFSANEKVSVSQLNGTYQISSPSYSLSAIQPVRFFPDASSTILRIDNFERRTAWDNTLNDNEFRGILEVRSDSTNSSTLTSNMNVVNELDLESYLKGLAETTNDDPVEKKKAIVIAARTYADYYLTIGKGKKFPGKPYDLDDDPEHTQKYRGYGYEKRSPASAKTVDDTRGQVIEYLGKVVIAPYFSTSNGMTLSALSAWGWKDAAYLPSVDDPYCKGMTRFGHGVGMSGCGALGMAKNGATYDQILKYYYKGITIEKIY